MNEPSELEISRSALAIMIGLLATEVAIRLVPDNPRELLNSLRASVLDMADRLHVETPATAVMLQGLAGIALPEAPGNGGSGVASD